MPWQLMTQFPMSRGQYVYTQLSVNPLQYVRVANLDYEIEEVQPWLTLKLARPTSDQLGTHAVFWQKNLYDKLSEIQAPDTGIANARLSLYYGTRANRAIAEVAIYFFI